MYFIGIDIGTSSTKIILTDEKCEIIKSFTQEYETEYFRTGWSEQDPDLWYNAVKTGIPELIKDIDSSLICGIGTSGQMHGLVILDKNNKVIRPAILWNDGRTEEETDWLNSTVGKERLTTLTGNIAFAGFTAPKLLWLRKHEPDNFEKIARIMLPKDYINFRLTGVHSSDYSDASGTLLLDVKNKAWSKQMMEICALREEQMPALFDSYECIGEILPEEAKSLGLPRHVKVAAGAGDNAAAAVGTGTIGEGTCNISLGTSGTVFIPAESFLADENNGLHSFAHADGNFNLLGCVLSAASCNKWLMDKVFLADDYAEEQRQISIDDLGNNHVFFLPYLMGERSPINDTKARGTFTGITLKTERKNLTQAVLEGVAFAIRDNIEVAKRLGIRVRESKVSGGGSKSRIWLDILANVLDAKLLVPKTEQGPGVGAAVLAMVACGIYADPAEASRRMEKSTAVVEPNPMLVERYEKQYNKFRQIYPAMKSIFQAIA